MRQECQADIAGMLAAGPGWSDTSEDLAAKVMRRVDEYVSRELAARDAEIDSATRLIARLQMAREVAVA